MTLAKRIFLKNLQSLDVCFVRNQMFNVLSDSQAFTAFSLKYHSTPALWIYVFKYFRYTSLCHFITSIQIISAPLTSGKYVDQLNSYLTF